MTHDDGTSGTGARGSAPQEDLLDLVGHELRSPLTSVLGYAQLLSAQSLTAEQHRYVDVIERNGRRLLRSIDELLVGARLATQEFDIVRQEVDLARVSRLSGHDLDGTARAAGVSLTVLAPVPVLISGDPELLTQEITSLLEGAIRRTPRDGAVTVRVAVCNEVTGEALVEVADTGDGVAPEEFAVHREAGGSGLGLGLGLPVVQAVVDAHGGDLSIDGVPGQGTRIRVILPTGRLGGAPSTGG